MEEDGDERHQRAAVRTLLGDLPDGYVERYAKLKAVGRVFHDELAAALQPAVAADAQRLPGLDLAQRRGWASDRNEELRALHLAFRCPRTGRPAALIVDTKDADPSHMRYRFQVYEGSRAVKTLTSTSLPQLEIVQDDLRVESLAHLGRRGGRGPSRS